MQCEAVIRMPELSVGSLVPQMIIHCMEWGGKFSSSYQKCNNLLIAQKDMISSPIFACVMRSSNGPTNRFSCSLPYLLLRQVHLDTYLEPNIKFIHYSLFLVSAPLLKQFLPLLSDQASFGGKEGILDEMTMFNEHFSTY